MFDWIIVDSGNFQTTEEKISFTMIQDVFKLNAPPKYLGNRLFLLGKTLSIEFDITFKTANSTLVLTFVGVNSDSFSFKFENISSGVRLAPVFQLNPSTVGVSMSRLQAVLFDLQSLELQFLGFPGDTGNFYGLSMLDVKKGPSRFGGVERCECPQNFTGNSCEKCAEGEDFSFVHFSDPYNDVQ